VRREAVRMTEVARRIPPLDKEAMGQARRRLDSLTKPRGSLGYLEELAVRLAGITGDPLPRVDPRVVVVMAGDHGVVEEGVSLYPPEVTRQMVENFLRGGAAINVLSRLSGVRVRVVDIGVAAVLDHPELERRKVRPGTANMCRGPAMSREEALLALEAGREIAEEEVSKGTRLICLGDMGIGNTTPSSAVISCLLGLPPREVTGRGTGLDDGGWQRKVAAVERALEVNSPLPSDPLDVLSKVGGLEIAGLCGLTLEAAARRVPVVVDGLIAGAAALLASRFAPRVRDYLFAGHLSAEPGHRLVLESLGLRPLLQLDLRLGEGTGAVLASFILEAACRVIREMATFEEAGVSRSLPETSPPGPDHPGQKLRSPEGGLAGGLLRPHLQEQGAGRS
jgi:nicotinate-nucleotide--dimethylbenzimidazole phosphoribosyltransferase